MLVINVDTPAKTAKLAKHIAQIIIKDYKATKLPTVILLEGEMGSGKTLFSKFFVNYFLYNKKSVIIVNSPTYNIANLYSNDKTSVYHLDLYRINNIQELVEIGFTEMLQYICIIEWASKLESLFNIYKTININIEAHNQHRKFSIYGNNINLDDIKKLYE